MIKVTEILQILSDNTRLRLLRLLAEEELSVAELQEILEMGQSRISTHLAQIRRHGLLNDRKDGKKTFYSLQPFIEGKGFSLVPNNFCIEFKPDENRTRAKSAKCTDTK